MWQATYIGLGNIIGAGIFVLAGTVINISGPGAILAFVLTAVLATTVALNSAELSSKVITHGGLYSFVRVSMGDGPGFLIGWLRSISYAIAASAVALGFASYLAPLLHFPQNPLLIPGIAIMLIIAVTSLDYAGLQMVARAEKYLVLITVSGLLVFIVSALLYGSWTTDRFGPLLPYGPLSIIEAASLAFFAYSGFNTVATLTPEVQNGPVNVPKAILISLLASTLFYLLIVLGMLALMPWTNYAITANPLQNALDYSSAPAFISTIIAMVALIATVSVTMSLVVAGSRTLLQMSEDGMFPRWIGGFSGDSPRIAVLLIGAGAIASLFLGNLKFIALASNFGVIFSYALTGVAVVILRKNAIPGKFLAPFYPWVQFLSLVLSIVVMVSLGVEALYLGAIFVLIGIILFGVIQARERTRDPESSR
ncbi:MAG: amino acid permease [Methanomicrobiales archaeon]|nr:amino acid permease [Methanomicrobiales archaeon]